MTKIAGSGSISQRHGSEKPDPDPPQNVMDPQHCFIGSESKDEESASVTNDNYFSGPLRDLGGLASCGAEHCHSQANGRFLLQV
jgi:hypothetical protein